MAAAFTAPEPIVSEPIASVSTARSTSSRATRTPAVTLPLLVTNTGTADLVFGGRVIRGSNTASFSQTTTDCTTVAPGGQCTITVTLARGTATGAKTAELAVSTNATVNETVVTLGTNMVANTAPKAGPSISDTTPTQGSAVTASSAPIVDPDGTTTSTITFQWQQNKGGNTAFADIAGATGPTFTPGAAQVNKRLRVVASYVDDHGTTELIATPQTTVVGILITNGSGNLAGTAGDDNITGGAGHDTITGLGGNDILNGGGGNDAINGGAGDDTINGGPGTDTIDGDAGNDTLAGDEGNDSIIGNGGADTIRFSGTGGGFDSVTGGGDDRHHRGDDRPHGDRVDLGRHRRDDHGQRSRRRPPRRFGRSRHVELRQGDPDGHRRDQRRGRR